MVWDHLYFALHFAWCSWPCILWESILPQFCDGSVTLWNLSCYAVDLWHSLELLLSVLYQCTMFCDAITSFFSSNSNIASTWIPKLVHITSWLFEPKFSPFPGYRVWVNQNLVHFVDTVGIYKEAMHGWFAKCWPFIVGEEVMLIFFSFANHNTIEHSCTHTL